MTPTITWLEKVRRLPDALKAETVAAAHDVARTKLWKTERPGSPQYCAYAILYYDEDTWRVAYEHVRLKMGDR